MGLLLVAMVACGCTTRPDPVKPGDWVFVSVIPCPDGRCHFFNKPSMGFGQYEARVAAARQQAFRMKLDTFDTWLLTSRPASRPSATQAAGE